MVDFLVEEPFTEESFVEESLAETLGFEEKYDLVHETEETAIYAHTIYYEVPKINYDQFITEDETPVDNLYSEAQQRLYIDPLYANLWTTRKYMACSNVAIYYKQRVPPVVPDMFLSFDVTKPKEWYEKKNKCYFMWRMKKPPELVIEIVSNKEGNENTTKFDIYAQMGVLYYIIHDPYKELYDKELNVFQLVNGKYEPYNMDTNCYMPELTLGLVMWEGLFENASAPFVRWCDGEGTLMRTGAEGIIEEAKRADEEAKRADDAEEEAKAEAEAKLAEAKRADEEAKRADEEAKRADEAEEAKLAEAKRADEAEAKIQALLKKLADMGLPPLD